MSVKRTTHGLAYVNASATLYSIVQTAIANGLMPYDYLMHVLEKIMHGENDSQKLAPWNLTLS